MKEILSLIRQKKECIDNAISHLTMKEIEELKLIEQSTAILEAENAILKIVRSKSE